MEQILEGIEMGIAIIAFVGAILISHFLTRECDRLYLISEQRLGDDRVIQKEESLFLNEWLTDE